METRGAKAAKRGVMVVVEGSSEKRVKMEEKKEEVPVQIFEEGVRIMKNKKIELEGKAVKLNDLMSRSERAIIKSEETLKAEKFRVLYYKGYLATRVFATSAAEEVDSKIVPILKTYGDLKEKIELFASKIKDIVKSIGEVIEWFTFSSDPSARSARGLGKLFDNLSKFVEHWDEHLSSIGVNEVGNEWSVLEAEWMSCYNDIQKGWAEIDPDSS